MSWLFTRPDGLDFFVNVRTPLLEERLWDEPFIETFTAEKLPWAVTPARHSYPAFPPPESYEALIAEYAALRASG
jgi:hypothetical protein